MPTHGSHLTGSGCKNKHTLGRPLQLLDAAISEQEWSMPFRHLYRMALQDNRSAIHPRACSCISALPCLRPSSTTPRWAHPAHRNHPSRADP